MNTPIENIISDGYLDLSCACCSSEKKYYTSKLDKLHTIVCQASNEFLNISVYVILGALISSIFGSVIKEEILSNYTFNNVLAVVIMIGISFLLSLCSEADAFVAAQPGQTDIIQRTGIAGFRSSYLRCISSLE